MKMIISLCPSHPAWIRILLILNPFFLLKKKGLGNIASLIKFFSKPILFLVRGIIQIINKIDITIMVWKTGEDVCLFIIILLSIQCIFQYPKMTIMILGILLGNTINPSVKFVWNLVLQLYVVRQGVNRVHRLMLMLTFLNFRLQSIFVYRGAWLM